MGGDAEQRLKAGQDEKNQLEGEYREMQRSHEDLGTLRTLVEKTREAAKDPNASKEAVLAYQDALKRMEKLMVRNGAPDDVILFLRSEAHKIYLNRIPWNDVILKHSEHAVDVADIALREKSLHPDCCGSTACLTGAVKHLQLLKERGERKRAQTFIDWIADEQRISGRKSCLGIQFDLGMDKLVAPVSSTFPQGKYLETVLPEMHPAPFWESSEIPLGATLEANAAAILADAAKLPGMGADGNPDAFGTDHLQTFLAEDESTWTTMNLMNEGVWNEDSCSQLPSVCKLLKGRPELEGRLKTTWDDGGDQGEEDAEAQLTFVSVYRLRPPAKIYRHCGNQWRLNVHFGLRVPEGAQIKVWGESRRWEVGKALTFFDAAEHEVEFPQSAHGNLGDRLVLNIVIWHPEVMKRRAEDPEFAAHFI